AVMPAADHADQADHAYGVRTAPPLDHVPPEGPPGSVTGPVAPTTTASGTHHPVTRARLAGGLLHQWQQRNLAASLPLALRQLEDAGNLENVRLAIKADRAAQRKAAAAEGEKTSGADGYGAAGGHRRWGSARSTRCPGPATAA